MLLICHKQEVFFLKLKCVLKRKVLFPKADDFGKPQTVTSSGKIVKTKSSFPKSFLQKKEQKMSLFKERFFLKKKFFHKFSYRYFLLKT